MGPLAARAQIEGYSRRRGGAEAGPQPFHGYLFKVLPRLNLPKAMCHFGLHRDVRSSPGSRDTLWAHEPRIAGKARTGSVRVSAPVRDIRGQKASAESAVDPSTVRGVRPKSRSAPVRRAALSWWGILAVGAALAQSGCMAPIGADRTTPARVYGQVHDNPVSRGQPSRETQSVLHRFDYRELFQKSPDEVLTALQAKAVETRDRGLLYALAELHYLTGERVRRSVRRWELRDARDYYLAAAVHAWWFLFDASAGAPADALDPRYRAACDLYNHGLGWALTERRATNSAAILAGGTRRLPGGQVEIRFDQAEFPWPLTEFDSFVLADHHLVRGLSVRNRRPGIGTPLGAITRATGTNRLARAIPCTVLLRVENGLAPLDQGKVRAFLELYSAFDAESVRIGDRSVPLETDLSFATAYTLNQRMVWRLGRMQFLSSEERIPTGIYLTQPYQPGRIPVVLVHGTFSSPVWWAELTNSLAADPLLRQRFQFWYFIYNSGNPVLYSAVRLREALDAKLRELDPEGRDAALSQMVVIGHSQGGLLTKLTATDTGDLLLNAVLGPHRLDESQARVEAEAALRPYTCLEALPWVKRVVFISTPHRGSYLATGLARTLARRFVSLPAKLVQPGRELAALAKQLDLPKELRRTPTSIDGMSPSNPVLLTLAEIPLAPGVIGHSIIPVLGEGDYREGKDGLVTYRSAHVDYVDSEFIVRGPHSCQNLPPAVEEVGRILREHLRMPVAAPLTERPT